MSAAKIANVPGVGVPLWPYQRVEQALRRKIESGELAGQLPSRLELAAQFHVSHMTVQRAIDALKDDGLLTSVAGLGVFVAER